MIGAGHAGLAISRVLAERAIDHTVLERGEVANSWRCERWDSLRLLTPNWQSRLPGYAYAGADPDGFMTMPELIRHITNFAAETSAPVRTHTAVTAVRRADGGYQVATDQGEIRCRCVVLASGAANVPRVPALRQGVPEPIECVTAFDYHNPQRLPPGGVLVVGASATGVQLADEILRSGRRVTLAVGEHVRLPRRYRGQDVLWWMERSGVWSQRYDEIDDLDRARGLPSPQLVGTPEPMTLDLNALQSMGVEIVGRLSAIRDGRALFSGGLRNQFALADLKMQRLLDTFDAWASSAALDVEVTPAERFEPTRAPT
ncbi:MAG TPA: FAD-dependent oxidoreductase, partial [Steroidobacteraceae bacterium]